MQCAFKYTFLTPNVCNHFPFPSATMKKYPSSFQRPRVTQKTPLSAVSSTFKLLSSSLTYDLVSLTGSLGKPEPHGIFQLLFFPSRTLEGQESHNQNFSLNFFILMDSAFHSSQISAHTKNHPYLHCLIEEDVFHLHSELLSSIQDT